MCVSLMTISLVREPTHKFACWTLGVDEMERWVSRSDVEGDDAMQFWLLATRDSCSVVRLEKSDQIRCLIYPCLISSRPSTASLLYLRTMKPLVASAALLLGTVAAAKSIGHTIPPQYIFANSDVDDEELRIPTVRESAAMARKIMHLTTVGDLVTVFPKQSNSDVDTSENRPADAAGSPIGLMEYYADCDPTSGNPILLALDIATPYRNYNAGSNISLSIRWWPTQKNTYSVWAADDDDEIPTPHTPAALPRFSLHGRLEPMSQDRLKDGKIQACFLRSHPDSIYWQPGNDIHRSQYVQLVVDHVYWFGGFGDRARIGWLPTEVFKNFTMEEIIKTKLPGEKKARSWWKQWL